MSKGKGAGKGVDPRKKPRAKGQALPHSFLVPATYLWAWQRQGEEPTHSEQSGFRLMLETTLKNAMDEVSKPEKVFTKLTWINLGAICPECILDEYLGKAASSFWNFPTPDLGADLGIFPLRPS